MSQKPRSPSRLKIPLTSSAQSLHSDSLLYGVGWTDSTLCLPWADVYGVRRFAVFSPAYGGDVLTCCFGDGWWNEGFGVFITGVTHWRLADKNEQEYWLDPAEWPEPGAMGIGLAEQRWHWLHINGPCDIVY